MVVAECLTNASLQIQIFVVLSNEMLYKTNHRCSVRSRNELEVSDDQ